MIAFSEDRVRAFINKRPHGGARVVLNFESVPNVLTTIGTWEHEVIEEQREKTGSLESSVTSIVEAGQEFANAKGESCNFSLQWLMEAGKSLKTVLMRCACDEGSVAASERRDATAMEALLRMNSELLTALDRKDKMSNAANGIVLTSLGQIINLQSQLIENLGRQVAAIPASAPRTPEDAEVSILKAQALHKLIELGPDVARLGIAAIGNAMGLDGASVVSNANGGGGDAH